MNIEDGQLFTLFVFCNFLVLLSTTVSSQNIKKHIINIADENLTDYNFLCRYHYTKSKNYLKRRYRIRHWIPMFIGKPCTLPSSIAWPSYTIYYLNFTMLSQDQWTSFDEQQLLSRWPWIWLTRKELIESANFY